MQEFNKIILCGFMGAGKTTLFNHLKSRLPQSWSAYDSDELIKAKCEQSISEIVASKGWDHFRAIEKEVILSVLEKENLLLSLGGGSLTQELIIAIADHGAKLVWLDTDFETSLNNARQSLSDRPLLKKSNEELFDLYNQRLSFYKQAHFSIKLSDLAELKTFKDFIRLLVSS